MLDGASSRAPLFDAAFEGPPAVHEEYEADYDAARNMDYNDELLRKSASGFGMTEFVKERDQLP